MNDFWNPMNKDNVYDFLEEIGVCEKDEIKNADIDKDDMIVEGEAKEITDGS